MTQNSLSITAIPAFDDNYLWLIHNDRSAVIVDPGDAAPVLDVLAKNQLSLCAILITHHHVDHIGGVKTLLQRYPAIPVYGPVHEMITTVSRPCGENDRVIIPELGCEFKVIETPGHTQGHIVYYSAAQHLLFSGDTLFAGGCGRLFEGTAKQMFQSLTKLSQLPDDTKVYCAHEYTLSNLRFAKKAEPGNKAIDERIAVEQAKRDRDQPTIPSTIALEKATNPFLRTAEPGIIQQLTTENRLKNNDPVSVLAALREWKNEG